MNSAINTQIICRDKTLQARILVLKLMGQMIPMHHLGALEYISVYY